MEIFSNMYPIQQDVFPLAQQELQVQQQVQQQQYKQVYSQENMHNDQHLFASFQEQNNFTSFFNIYDQTQQQLNQQVNTQFNNVCSPFYQYEDPQNYGDQQQIQYQFNELQQQQKPQAQLKEENFQLNNLEDNSTQCLTKQSVDSSIFQTDDFTQDSYSSCLFVSPSDSKQTSEFTLTEQKKTYSKKNAKKQNSNKQESNQKQQNSQQKKPKINTSHVPNNLINLLTKFLTPIYYIQMKCEKNPMKLYKSDPQFLEQSKCECRRCQELKVIIKVKYCKKKNLTVFKDLVNFSPRIKALVEHFFLNEASITLLDKQDKYRSKETFVSLYKTLGSFLQGNRNTKNFIKIC